MEHITFNKIVELFNKIYAIKKYSYEQRGLKFDTNKTDAFLSENEKALIIDIENQIKKLFK